MRARNDGKFISYDSNTDSPNGMQFIWIMNLESKERSRISYTPDSGEVRMPAWTTDNRIVHIRHLDEGEGDSEIFLMDRNGANIKRLTENSVMDRYPRSSFQDDQIAYISQSHQEGGLLQVFVIDSTKKITQLTNTGTSNSNCTWTPNNKIIYVDYSPKRYNVNNGTIWIMDSDGNNKKQITYNHGLKLEEGG